MTNDSIRYLHIGDSGLIIEFGNQISPEINQKVTRLLSALDQQPIQGILDLIPTYRSLYLQYDPLVIHPDTLKKKVADLIKLPETTSPSLTRTIEIPVVYGGEKGPDLESVAEYHHLTPQEVIRIHSSGDYFVYMLGFLPGFPYLGGMSEKIATPRLKTPRLNVPAGSVGIAEQQTGIYPTESPGGWRIIGRTTVQLFSLASNPPALLRPGDRVKFVII